MILENNVHKKLTFKWTEEENAAEKQLSKLRQFHRSGAAVSEAKSCRDFTQPPGGLQGAYLQEHI